MSIHILEAVVLHRLVHEYGSHCDFERVSAFVHSRKIIFILKEHFNIFQGHS